MEVSWQLPRVEGQTEQIEKQNTKHWQDKNRDKA
jgi:hypothetical protein